MDGWMRTYGKAQNPLHKHLPLMDPRMGIRIQLVVNVILAERQHGDQIRPRTNSKLDKPLAALQHQAQRMGFRVQRLSRAADDDGDGAAHALAVAAAFRQNVLAALARHGGQAHAQGVVAVEGDAEVGVEGEEGVGDAGE